MDEEAWREHLEHQRAEKDQFLAQHLHSPLPREARGGFDGLAYYDPDPAYRFVTRLDESEAGETIEVPRTAGDTVTYERAGTFHLDLPGGEVALSAYRTGNHAGDELFVPFRDATSGDETYGAGRYLEAHGAGDGRWIVDLNEAYHPFCAYDEAYTCPLPPFENHLDVPVRAGERLAAEA